MQDQVMKFDPATGAPQPYPSHAEQWRRWFGLDCAWLFNPWSGDRRNAFDVGSDLNGRLIVAPETLYRASVAGQDDLVALLTAGVTVETAGDEPEAV